LLSETGSARLHGNNGVNLPAIKSNHISRLILDIGSCHEGHIFSEGLARPMQHIRLFRVGKEVHVASIHIDRVQQSSLVRGEKMLLEGVDSDLAFRFIGQQGCGDSVHFAARLLTANEPCDRGSVHHSSVT
jgi:hypothetical protein